MVANSGNQDKPNGTLIEAIGEATQNTANVAQFTVFFEFLNNIPSNYIVIKSINSGDIDDEILLVYTCQTFGTFTSETIFILSRKPIIDDRDEVLDDLIEFAQQQGISSSVLDLTITRQNGCDNGQSTDSSSASNSSSDDSSD